MTQGFTDHQRVDGGSDWHEHARTCCRDRCGRSREPRACVSTFRGERDIAIGNLIGSSIYNIAFVLAATTIVVPGHIPVPEVIRTDLALIAIVSLVCIPVFFSSRTMNRIEGALFVLAYCGYLVWLLTTQA